MFLIAMSFLDIISSQGFIHILTTFGLAVVLVLYYVVKIEPRRTAFWQDQYNALITDWQEKYNILIEEYDRLAKNYIKLEEDLHAESRECSIGQTTKLAFLGLDRDLYKLYYYMCGKLDRIRVENIGTFITESVRDTNETWEQFKSSFPRVERIGNLYAVYTNSGESLNVRLEEILSEEIPDEEKKSKIWSLLYHNTVEMKKQFQAFIQDLKSGKEVKPYGERAEASED